MRDYGKVYGTFWSSDTTGGLSDDAKLLALYLLTCNHATIAGVFRLPDGYVAEDLNWSLEKVAQGFAELFAKDFANRCEVTKWVWVKKHFEWNKPENPNQRKAAFKVVNSVPDQCVWKRDFWREAAAVLALDPHPDSNPFKTVKQTLVEPFRNQEQELEQKLESQGADAPLSPASQTKGADGPALILFSDPDEPAAIPPCPLKQLVGMYAARLPELPKPRYELWKDGEGADAMRQRWKWLLSSEATRDDGTRYAATAAEGLEWFSRFFENVADSDLLMGRKSAWRADLGWLMKRANFTKVVQGNYVNREAA